VEKRLSKLDDPTLDPNLDNKATLRKFDDAKLDPKSNYTFAKCKELYFLKIVFEIWRPQRWYCVEHRFFHAHTN